MPPANRDSSELTRRRNAMSLNAWKSDNDAANTTGSSVRKEQASDVVLSVVTERIMGGCYCGAANASMTDSRNVPGSG